MLFLKTYRKIVLWFALVMIWFTADHAIWVHMQCAKELKISHTPDTGVGGAYKDENIVVQAQESPILLYNRMQQLKLQIHWQN